jgi:hypothetical protein
MCYPELLRRIVTGTEAGRKEATRSILAVKDGRKIDALEPHEASLFGPGHSA